jgi:hypothetical protein
VTLTAFLQTVIGALGEAGVSYMLTGSLAAAFYAVPRATQGVDVVIETEQAGLDRLVARLLEAGRPPAPGTDLATLGQGLSTEVDL